MDEPKAAKVYRTLRNYREENLCSLIALLEQSNDTSITTILSTLNSFVPVFFDENKKM